MIYVIPENKILKYLCQSMEGIQPSVAQTMSHRLSISCITFQPCPRSQHNSGLASFQQPKRAGTAGVFRLLSGPPHEAVTTLYMHMRN